MVDEFILRHHGKKAVRYLVPEMKEILNNTYGIIVYQEQIMQLAQKLAGYTLSEADLMRRAMGKKKREEMAVHEEKFINGAVERGIKREKAEKIFSLMAQFSDYGFNRSHSVAYAYLAFQTAYLKAHYPEHFYAAVLSSEAQDAAKVFKYSKELRAQKIALLPPDVNESNSGFTPLSGAIRYGLTAIKGLGQSTVKAISEARQSGQFRSFFDFAERVESSTLNKRVFESLVSGAAHCSVVLMRRCRVRSDRSASAQSGKAGCSDRCRRRSTLPVRFRQRLKAGPRWKCLRQRRPRSAFTSRVTRWSAILRCCRG
jgi:DNA polymerase-3 subunit alpha